MAKRVQEQERDNRIVAKSKPTVNSLIASKSPRILKAPCRTDCSSTGKLVATEEDQEHLNYPEDSVRTGKPGNPGNSGDSGTEGNDEGWPHNIHISTHYVLHMEKVFSIVRQRYGRSPTDQMKDLDVNAAISLHAAGHLGKDLTENLRSTKNRPKKSLRQLFQVTERFITDQTEITGLTTIDWQQHMWRKTTLLTDRAVQLATAKTNVFSDSVLCLGGMSDEQVETWESRINWFMESRPFGELDRISGEPMELECKNFPRVHYIGNSRRDSKDDD